MANFKNNNLNDSTFRCGWVAVMGPPNAGKSTLLNSMLGQKITIVTPKPQTTRNQITGILTERNTQIIFMDTPGIAQLRGHLNKTMAQAVWRSMDQANIILLVIDAHSYILHPECFDKDLTPLKDALAQDNRTLIVAANKIDIFADKSRMLPLLTKISQTWSGAEIIPVSAINGDGLKELLGVIRSKLPEGTALFPEDQISTASLRFMVAEIVREKLFLNLRQEVPYGVAVEIENWQEKPERGLTIINAAILVAKSAYKAMVLGKKGEIIKKIGIEARKDIESLLETHIHLDLFVKVRENWMNDPALLNRLSEHSNLE